MSRLLIPPKDQGHLAEESSQKEDEKGRVRLTIREISPCLPPPWRTTTREGTVERGVEHCSSEMYWQRKNGDASSFFLFRMKTFSGRMSREVEDLLVCNSAVAPTKWLPLSRRSSAQGSEAPMLASVALRVS